MCLTLREGSIFYIGLDGEVNADAESERQTDTHARAHVRKISGKTTKKQRQRRTRRHS